MDFNKLRQQIDFLGTYNNILEDIKNYNRADTVNMSEKEMNKFRHIAGPAVLTSNYYTPSTTATLGYLKELKDLSQGRGLADTRYDLRNNEIGIGLGKQFPNTSKKRLYDYIYKTHIEPYRHPTTLNWAGSGDVYYTDYNGNVLKGGVSHVANFLERPKVSKFIELLFESRK